MTRLWKEKWDENGKDNNRRRSSRSNNINNCEQWANDNDTRPISYPPSLCGKKDETCQVFKMMLLVACLFRASFQHSKGVSTCLGLCQSFFLFFISWEWWKAPHRHQCHIDINGCGSNCLSVTQAHCSISPRERERVKEKIANLNEAQWLKANIRYMEKLSLWL